MQLERQELDSASTPHALRQLTHGQCGRASSSLSMHTPSEQLLWLSAAAGRHAHGQSVHHQCDAAVLTCWKLVTHTHRYHVLLPPGDALMTEPR